MMLEHSTRRRLATVLALALTTNTAGYVGAQAPVPSTGGRTPKLISNCDFTQSNCNGDPVFGGGPPSGGYWPPPVNCGGGFKTVCTVTTVKTCTSWVVVSADGKIEFSPTQVQINGHLSGDCAEYYETTVTTYRP